ncbi:MFS transporter [Segniliparus rotundus]|uniref:MFS transporter n=1 Tax=Segniliparus rotundus TaxID=286802 RepID=UPI003CCA929E
MEEEASDQSAPDHDSAGQAAPEATETEDELSSGDLFRAIGASAIGNAAEWFDYGIYSLTVPYLSQVFFPGAAKEATLYALLTFAVSFLVRPLGGIVWGPLGDRWGRQRVLSLTIILMSGSTCCIGLLPGHAVIGAAAPVILILLRLLQGFSTGGEYGGAATFMAECSPDHRRGLCGSFLEFGSLLGYAFGALLVLFVALFASDSQMAEWGWRVPYLIAAPLGLVGLYLRSRLDDTPAFQELEASGNAKGRRGRRLQKLVKRQQQPLVMVSVYRKELLLLAGLVTAFIVPNYTLLTYMPTYLHLHLGMGSSKSLALMLIVQLGMMAVLPFSGASSDRVGRKPVWLVSLAGLFVFAAPMFLVMRSGFAAAGIGLGVLCFFHALQLSMISSTFPAMLPTHVRFAGFAIAYNIAASVFGGTTPAVDEWLIDVSGSTLTPAWYIMASCVVGLVSLVFVTETAGVSLKGFRVPGVGPEQPAEDESV